MKNRNNIRFLVKKHAVQFPVILLSLIIILSCGGEESPDLHVLDLSINNRQVDSIWLGSESFPKEEHSKIIKVKQDDTVIFKWKTDEEVAIHIHGYDLDINAKPDHIAELHLLTIVTGRFLIEGHFHGDGAEIHLLYLEVNPR